MKAKTGTREWSESSFNWQVGCSNGCLYCYARQAALRWRKIDNPNDWTTEKPILLHIEERALTTRRNGVIMCPTNHDITPANLESSRKILWALARQNRLLVVSKPHLGCIRALCKDLKEFTDRVEFRFTIGASDDEVRAFWEPNAPTLRERWECVESARSQDFIVSISCEPLLQPWSVSELVRHGLRHDVKEIWVGCLNKLRQRVAWKQDFDFNSDYVRRLERWQTPLMMRRLYEQLKDIPQVRWKDSYQKALGLKSCRG